MMVGEESWLINCYENLLGNLSNPKIISFQIER